MAINNAKIYKVEDNITFLTKDFLDLTKEDFKEAPTVIFLSPPWGGVDYAKEVTYDFNKMHPDFRKILTKSLELSNNLILFMPRNIDLDGLADILYDYPILFPESRKERIITVEALIHGNNNIKAFLINIGPLFIPKLHEIMPDIKFLLKAQLEAYENIVINNVLRYKPFYECYELAQKISKEGKGVKEYIQGLKDSLTEEEWSIIKKLHKKPDAIDKLTMTNKPIIPPIKRPPSEYLEGEEEIPRKQKSE